MMSSVGNLVTASLLLLLVTIFTSSAQVEIHGDADEAENCQLPARTRPILRPLDEEDEAITEAKCYTACAAKLLNQVRWWSHKFILYSNILYCQK